MANYNALEVCKADLFTAEHELKNKYPDNIIKTVIRIRDSYNYLLSNPEAKDKDIVYHILDRFKDVSKSTAYNDLGIIKALLPLIGQNSREFHRWRYGEIIMESYRMAKRRGDTKTMERCATSYAKYHKVDLEDELKLPFDKIVPQHFIATMDVRVLGIEPIPNVYKVMEKLTKEMSKDVPEILDVDFEEPDLIEDKIFNPLDDEE